MNKKNKKILSAALVSSAAVVGSGYLLFEEIMSRNAFIFPKVSNLMMKLDEKKRQQEKEKNGVAVEEQPDVVEENIKWFQAQDFKEYEIINKDGLHLKGYLLAAEKESDVYVFCAHGYTSQGRHEFAPMGKFWHDMGYNVFLIDHQAHGSSEGKWIGFGVRESVDGILWLDFMKETFGEDIKIILHGVSMGSATVTIMTGDEELPKNVVMTVADCGFTTCREEFEFVMKSSLHLPKFPVFYVAEEFNKIINKYDFSESAPVESVKNAQIPMLFIHGSEDNFVPTKMVHELFDNCASEKKEKLIVEGAGHACSYRVNPEIYEETVKRFISENVFVTE